VVIAIIGILAAIVLVSLSGARDRAKDARIQADMSQVRSAAELYADDNGNYAGLANNDDIMKLENDIEAQTGNNNSFVLTIKNDNTGYCAYVPLVASSNEYYCVDSNLVAKKINNTANCSNNTVVTCD